MLLKGKTSPARGSWMPLSISAQYPIFFLFLSGYPHTLLKSETNLVRGSWIPLLISALPENQTCVLILAGI
jgi:hypothetical protein